MRILLMVVIKIQLGKLRAIFKHPTLDFQPPSEIELRRFPFLQSSVDVQMVPPGETVPVTVKYR
jgi:hypothetical protein